MRRHLLVCVWLVGTMAGVASWPLLGRIADAAVADAAFVQAIPGSALRWYKGNTHTHTLNSDGDSTPDEVVRWYREHGYHFLVLTDHNFLTSVDGLNAVHGADEKFLVIKGEEVTSSFDGKSVHVNGLDVAELVAPTRNASSLVATIQGNVDGIRKVDGVPHINHPNFQWSMTADDISQVRNNRLFEVYNGHPTVHNNGGGGVPSLEQMWDQILSRGVELYGVAVDDAHTFKQPGNPNVAGPGRGWVAIRAARLEARTLLEALERGDFYASTGVELTDVQATATSLTVLVRPQGNFKYRIQFIGAGGRVLREVEEPAATYTFAGTESYVRAKVIDSGGRVAWVQPVFVQARTAPSGR
jgi:hypothetical protein